MLLSDVSEELRERIAYDELHAGTLRAAGIRSLMVVPLSARGRTFGAMTLAFAESDRRYSSLDLQVALDLAKRAAMTTDNACFSVKQSTLRQRFEVLDHVSLVLSQRLSQDDGGGFGCVLSGHRRSGSVGMRRRIRWARHRESISARPFDRWVFSGFPPDAGRSDWTTPETGRTARER